MEDNKKVLNNLFVEVFNYILLLEERHLKENNIKNLSMTEVHVLEAIEKADFKSMSTIADILMITIGTLTTSMNRLVSKGYVKRWRDENDKRVVLVNLTNEGKAALKIHEAFHTDMIDAVLDDVLEEDELSLIKALDNLRSFFKNLKDKV